MTPRTQFARLLWKEYRQVRAFGWLLLGAGLALVLFPLFSPFATARVMAVLFAAAAAATIFSNEHENGTFWFQRALPTTLRDVALAKICVAIVGAIGIFLVLWLSGQLTLVVTGRSWPADASRMDEFGEGLLTIFEFLVFGTLMSLVDRRPLVALAKTVALVISVRWFGFLLDLVVYPGLFYVPSNPWTSIAFRGIAIAVGGFMAFRYATKWYADTPIQLLSPMMRSKLWQTPTSLFQIESVLRGQWRRLLWLQTRVSIWPFATITIIGVAISILDSVLHQVTYRAVCASMLLGAFTFRAAKSHQNALRAFAASSMTVWFSQLAIPAFCCVIVSITLTFTHPYWREQSQADFVQRSMLISVAATIASFTWGQLASLASRTMFGSIGLSTILSIPALLWAVVVVEGKAPHLLFLTPIFLYPLIESIIRSRRWNSDETRRAHHWWAIRLGLYAALSIGLIVFRACEIPLVTNEQLAEALADVPRLSPNQLRRFRSIGDELEKNQANRAEWVNDHRREVDEILGEDFTKNALPSSLGSIQQKDFLRAIFIYTYMYSAFESSVRHSDVELGERIIAKHPFMSPWQGLNVVRWCQLPKNDSVQIRELARRIQSSFDDETILQSIEVFYNYRFHSRGDPSIVRLVDAARWIRQVRVEAVRIHRLTKFVMGQIRKGVSLNELKSMSPRVQLALAGDRIDGLSGDNCVLFQEIVSRFEQQTRSLRGTILQLALMSWQLDHVGQLPGSLDELKGEYLDSIPNDLSTGMPFLLIKDRRPVTGHIYYKNELLGIDGKLPPFLCAAESGWDLSLPEPELVEQIWATGNPSTWLFPLGLPAEESESKHGESQPANNEKSEK